MRATSEITFHGLLGLALAAIFYVNPLQWKLILLCVAAALVVYTIAYNSPLRWTMPRRRHHVPSFAVCFLGAFAVTFLLRDTDAITRRTVVAALAGAFAALYTAVKIGVPTHVGIVVNAESASSHSRNGEQAADRGAQVAGYMRRRGLFDVRDFNAENVGVWPEHFEVAQEGSVVWFINGPPGTTATIRFDQGFDPFSQPDGEASVFTGTVSASSPAVIPAGPVVRSGRGAYTIELRPRGGKKVVMVRGGGSQTKG
jgi:hypothetical protein